MTIPHPDASEAKLHITTLNKAAPAFGMEEYDPTFDARQSAAKFIEALAIQLAEHRAEIESWKGVARSAGVCMTCALGAPEYFGCTDCLNTGWEGGAPAGFVAEAQLAAANAEIEAMEALHSETMLGCGRLQNDLHRTFAQLAAANARIAQAEKALNLIEGLHIPDQPSAYGGDELSWAQRHVGTLRHIARAWRNKEGT